MRAWFIGVFMLFMLLCAPAFAQAQMPPTISFDSVPDPLKLPDNMYLGEVSGIAVNSKGHIFVLTRGNTTGPAYAAAAAQLLEFAPDGKFLREIGRNLYAWSFAHTGFRAWKHEAELLRNFSTRVRVVRKARQVGITTTIAQEAIWKAFTRPQRIRRRRGRPGPQGWAPRDHHPCRPGASRAP